MRRLTIIAFLLCPLLLAAQAPIWRNSWSTNQAPPVIGTNLGVSNTASGFMWKFYGGPDPNRVAVLSDIVGGSATNAIGNLNGYGTNTTFYGPLVWGSTNVMDEIGEMIRRSNGFGTNLSLLGYFHVGNSNLTVTNLTTVWAAVGIRTNLPKATLHIWSEVGRHFLLIGSNATTPTLTITNACVGIGRQDPREALDLRGNLAVSGSAGISNGLYVEVGIFSLSGLTNLGTAVFTNSPGSGNATTVAINTNGAGGIAVLHIAAGTNGMVAPYRSPTNQYVILYTNVMYGTGFAVETNGNVTASSFNGSVLGGGAFIANTNGYGTNINLYGNLNNFRSTNYLYGTFVIPDAFGGPHFLTEGIMPLTIASPVVMGPLTITNSITFQSGLYLSNDVHDLFFEGFGDTHYYFRPSSSTTHIPNAFITNLWVAGVLSNTVAAVLDQVTPSKIAVFNAEKQLTNSTVDAASLALIGTTNFDTVNITNILNFVGSDVIIQRQGNNVLNTDGTDTLHIMIRPLLEGGGGDYFVTSNDVVAIAAGSSAVQSGSFILSNIVGIAGAMPTNIVGAGTVTVTSNNSGIYTITGSASATNLDSVFITNTVIASNVIATNFTVDTFVSTTLELSNALRVPFGGTGTNTNALGSFFIGNGTNVVQFLDTNAYANWLSNQITLASSGSATNAVSSIWSNDTAICATAATNLTFWGASYITNTDGKVDVVFPSVAASSTNLAGIVVSNNATIYALQIPSNVVSILDPTTPCIFIGGNLSATNLFSNSVNRAQLHLSNNVLFLEISYPAGAGTAGKQTYRFSTNGLFSAPGALNAGTTISSGSTISSGGAFSAASGFAYVLAGRAQVISPQAESIKILDANGGGGVTASNGASLILDPVLRFPRPSASAGILTNKAVAIGNSNGSFFVVGSTNGTNRIDMFGVNPSNIWVHTQQMTNESPGSLPGQPLACYGAMMFNATNYGQSFGISQYTNITGFNIWNTNWFTVNTNTGYMTNIFAGFYRCTINISMVGQNAGIYEGCMLTNDVDSELIGFKHQHDTPARLRSASGIGLIYLPANTGCSFAMKCDVPGAIQIHRGSITIGTP